MRRWSILALVALGACDSDFVDPAYRLSGYGDYGPALAAIRPLAEAGSSGAQFMLASMYDLGKGTAVDPAEAARWYRAAAEAGDRDAQLVLARMLRDGRGVARDPAEASSWFDLAGRSGLADAPFQAGRPLR